MLVGGRFCDSSRNTFAVSAYDSTAIIEFGHSDLSAWLPVQFIATEITYSHTQRVDYMALIHVFLRSRLKKGNEIVIKDCVTNYWLQIDDWYGYI